MRIQAFLLSLRLHLLRARHHHRVHVRRDLVACRNLRCGAQIFNAAVGAGADEHAIDLHVLELGVPAFRSMYSSARSNDLRSSSLSDVGRIRHRRRYRGNHAGARSPAHVRNQRGRIDHQFAIELRAGIRRQLAPLRNGRVPCLALRARSGGPSDTRTSSRRERSCRRARRLRCSCCRSSCGLPSRAREWPSPRTRSRSPVAPSVPILPMMARMMSFAVTPCGKLAFNGNAERLRRAIAAASAWPARAPLRWCRCRMPARRMRRAWKYASRRRRSSCRAWSCPVPDR